MTMPPVVEPIVCGRQRAFPVIFAEEVRVVLVGNGHAFCAGERRFLERRESVHALMGDDRFAFEITRVDYAPFKFFHFEASFQALLPAPEMMSSISPSV